MLREEKAKTSCLAVNRRLVPVKLSYFFVLGAVASLFPYVAVYMKQLGLTPAEVAIIYGTMPFIDALVRPIIGAIADKLQAHKIVLMVSCICTGISMAGLMFVPPIATSGDNPGISVKVMCSRDNWHVEYCTEFWSESTECQAAAGDTLYHRSYTLEPFINSTDCVMTCGLEMEPSGNSRIYFNNSDVTSTREYSHDSWHSNNAIIEVKFAVASINHSQTHFQYTNSSAYCLNVCYIYLVSEFMHNGTVYEDFSCTPPTVLECEVRCNSSVEANETTSKNDQYISISRFSKTFWMFFMIFLLGNIFYSPLFSMIDAMTYAFLGEERYKWGQQRMWGTVGYGVFGFVAGFSMDLYSSASTDINYLFCFIAYAVLSICGAISVCFYDISSHVSAAQMCKNLCTLLKNIEVVAILVFVFVCGMFVGVRETLLFWHLQTLGASQLLLGLCVLFNTIFGIPMLMMAKYVMKALRKAGCIYLVCLMFIVRYLGYSFLTNPWWALCLEPLQAVTFSLMYATASAYGSSVTPPGMHGTVQGLISGFHFGFGKGCGSLLGGAVFETYGAAITFQSCSGLALVLFIFLVMVQIYVTLTDQKQAELSENSEEKENLQNQRQSAVPNSMVEKVASQDCIL